MGKWLAKKQIEFNKALESRDVLKMRELFNKVPTVDLAIFANELEDPKSLLFVFKVVKSELTADFFTELSDETQEALLKAFTDQQIITLLNESYTDDIVDFLEDMPANLASRVLKIAPKEQRESVNKLLNYKEDTAATVMTTEFFEFKSNVLVKDAMKLIKEKGRDVETIYTVFLKDDKRNLIGTVDLDEMIFANDDQTLDEIKNSEFIFVKVDTDQEEVAKVVKKYDLNAVAVVNNDQKLIGVITVDDIMDVIEKETTEDITLQAGVIPFEDDYQNVGPFKVAMRCAPWLMILIVISILSSFVISKFEDQIASIVVLAAFIPVIMDTGGNAGGQTCSIFIRTLALKEYKSREYWRLVWKEVRGSFITGLFVAVVGFGVFIAEMSIPGLVSYEGANINMKLVVAGIVAVTLFLSIVLAKFIACILPYIAKKLKKDPALMSEPLVTTIVDLSALLIYFGITTFALQFIQL